MATSYINNMQIDSIPEISWKLLKKADRLIPVPFILKLRNEGKPLYCEKVIRVIPGKRIVVFGEWDHKPVVAKLFFNRSKAKKHLQRDLKGIEILTTANVPTPKLYFDGTDVKKHIHVLIFEKITDSCNLDLLWQEKTDVEEHTPLMRAVTIELATQHVMGIVQRDLHLKNFLVTSKTIYTLDGGSIEYFEGGPLPKKESLEHLGLFFAQLGAGTQELQKQLFDLYASSRGWIVRPADTLLLQQSIQNSLMQRWERYQKKIMRNCTAFAHMRRLATTIMVDREYQSENFLHFLKHPDIYFAKSDTQLLKAGGSSTVVKIRIDQRFFVVKRYNIKDMFHWLRRCIRPSRAVKSWQLAHHLRLEGISTAKPIAYIEKNFLGLRGKSYFIMEFVPGIHAGDYFSQYQPNKIAYEHTAQRIVSLFKNLAELRLTHGDLKMTNILLDHDKPVLIDLDGMYQHNGNRSFKRAFHKEMQRFMRNWEGFPSIKEMFQRLLGV